MTVTALPGRRTNQAASTNPTSTEKPQIKASKEEGKTVNVRANEKMLLVLGQLKSEFGINMSESLRKGADLLFLAKRQEQKGRRLAFIDDDDNVVVEVQTL
jgi:hypothetical protein